MPDRVGHGAHIFFNDTATTEIYTLSLHDALPISLSLIGDGVLLVALAWQAYQLSDGPGAMAAVGVALTLPQVLLVLVDRKSTRLNSSHANISYAVFCLKKKKNSSKNRRRPRECS